MKLVQITQISNDENLIHNCDLLLCGCGYEERCLSFVSRNLDGIHNISSKIVLSYKSPQIPELDEHRKFFSKFGFKEYQIDKPQEVTQALKDIFKGLTKAKKVKIVIDYSSMDRQWYSRILLFFDKYRDSSLLNVVCYFTYSVPVIQNESFDKIFSVSGVEALQGFSSISIPDKPTALIVGLGNDIKALAALKYFADIDYIHYFYTDNTYVQSLDEKYKSLFLRCPLEMIHKYSLMNMVTVFNTLCDIYKSIKDNYRLVLISCGPKPFTLMSLLFAQIYGVDVWYMKSNLGNHYVEKKSLGENITYAIDYLGI